MSDLTQLTPADFTLLSRVLCRGLVVFDFKPLEVLLVLILKDETFDANAVEGKVDLERWARALDMEPRKLRKHWRELRKVGVVDCNEGQGTYKVRPAASSWSRDRRVLENNLRAGPELQLSAPRPLSESLSELSLEQALDAGHAPGNALEGPDGSYPSPVAPNPVGSDRWRALIQSLDEKPVDRGCPGPVAGGAEKLSGGPADFSAGGPEKFSGASAEKLSGKIVRDLSASGPEPNRPAENSAAPIASLASVLQKLASYRPAEKSAGAEKLSGRAQKATGASPDKYATAWRFLEEADRRGTLKMQNSQARKFAAEWESLCQEDPDWVLGPLRKCLKRPGLEQRYHQDPSWDPLSYLAAVARDEGKFVFRRPTR